MDNPEEQSESPPMKNKMNKRRSSVFQRQSIGPKEQDLESTNITEEISHETKKLKLQNVSESFDLKKYIDALKEEDKKWREVYAKRKSRVQDLIKRDKNQQQSFDISCLSDSERVFLKAKPDYEEFNKNVFQLHAMATKVMFLNSCAENFSEKSAKKLKNETDTIMRRIINLSEV